MNGLMTYLIPATVKRMDRLSFIVDKCWVERRQFNQFCMANDGHAGDLYREVHNRLANEYNVTKFWFMKRIEKIEGESKFHLNPLHKWATEEQGGVAPAEAWEE